MALKPQLPIQDKTFTVFKTAVAAAKKEVDSLARLWKKNVDKTFGELPKDYDDEQILVNKDYPRSRQLLAQLMFRVPEVQAKPLHPDSRQIAPYAAAGINQTLRNMAAWATIEECMTDAIVPSGIGVSEIEYEAITQTVDMKPAAHVNTPDDVFAGLVESGAAEYEKVTAPTYECYSWRRISPELFLSPVDFDGLRWDEAPWIGVRFCMPAVEAKRIYKLSKDEVKQVMGKQPQRLQDDQPESSYEKVWGYKLYYRAAFYDEKATHKDQIRKLVYFDGLDKPVVHEDYQAQRIEQGKVFGVRRYPIRVLTKVFVPGRPIPPSDVTISRPQVKELEQSRTLQMTQRRRNIPVRGYDVNAVDESVESALQQGIVQDWIPFNGPGQNSIWEIAKSAIPRENFEYDRVLERDLSEQWGVGPTQLGQETPGETTATESQALATASNVRLDYDRTKVLRWFIEAAEVVHGLLQMYADADDYTEMIGEDGAKSLVAWNKSHMRGWFQLEARPDSALRLDAAADRAQALNLYQLLRRDEMIIPRGLLEEVIRTHNMNPDRVLLPQPPQPQPERPSVSFRFSGEDMDPTRPSAQMVYAILEQTGMKIPEEVLNSAKQQAVRTLELAAQNPMLALADTLRADYRGNAPGVEGAPPPQQPGHGGVQPQAEPLNKTQMQEQRVK